MKLGQSGIWAIVIGWGQDGCPAPRNLIAGVPDMVEFADAKRLMGRATENVDRQTELFVGIAAFGHEASAELQDQTCNCSGLLNAPCGRSFATRKQKNGGADSISAASSGDMNRHINVD